MSEKPNEPDTADAGVGNSDGTSGAGDFSTEVDPTFIRDESDETPEAKRAREHPEATGS